MRAPTDNDSFERDMESGALINKNSVAFRAAKRRKQAMTENQHRIERLEQSVQDLNEKFSKLIDIPTPK